MKKGAFFSYLIVIVTLIIYSLAFVKLEVVEKNKYVKDIEKFREVLDVKYNFDEKNLNNYFDAAYEISFTTALKKFLDGIDNSPDCKIKYINNKKYFSKECEINVDLFKEKLLEEFEKYIKSSPLFENFGVNSQYQCYLKENLTCEFVFEKIFVFSTNNITVKKKYKYEKSFDKEFFENLKRIKEESLKEKEQSSENIGKFLYYDENEKNLKFEDFYLNVYKE